MRGNLVRRVRVMDDRDQFTIETIGVPRFSVENGRELTVSGPLRRTMLIYVGLAPGMVVARRKLEAMFWPDAEPDKANGSLRSTLSTLRKELGVYADILTADRTDVRLDRARVRIDRLHAVHQVRRRLAEGHRFLDGTDLQSEEIEEWIRQERQVLAAWVATEPEAKLPAKVALSAKAVDEAPAMPVLLLNAEDGLGASALEVFMAESITAQLSQTAKVHARTDVRWVTGQAAPMVLAEGARCAVRVSRQNGSFVALARLTEEPSGKVHWYRQMRFDAGDADAAVDAAASLALEATEAFASCTGKASATERANAMAATALKHVFSFDPERLKTGERLLAASNALEPFAPRPALQALALAFLALEQDGTVTDDLKETAGRLMDDSLGLDSGNALALSFLADVHDLVFRDAQTALAYARCALRGDPGLGYAYASLGALELRRGKAQDALVAARRAERQLANSSLEVFALMRLCVASMMAGKFDTAMQAAERAANLAPTSCPPLRHLYALRLHAGDRPGAREALTALKRLEPEFSMARIREDPEFPASTLRSLGFHKIRDIEI